LGVYQLPSGSSSTAKRATPPKPKKRKSGKSRVDEYSHQTARRVSIPTEQTKENVTYALRTDKVKPLQGEDPRLFWDRRPYGDRSPVLPLHIREKISPRAMIQSLSSDRSQTRIFDDFNGFDPGTKYNYYDHSAVGNWQNRIIRGDSSRVLASLASENLEGEVQTIFFDPPYGIEFDSNFTPRMEDASNSTLNENMMLPKDPISVKAFCDKWDRGLASYFDSVFHQLTLMKKLLKDTGHIFVQIGSTNVHRMALLLDEVFGSENRISTITFATSTGSSSSFIPEGSHYLLWYAKSKPLSKEKYFQLYEQMTLEEKVEQMSSYAMIEEQGEALPRKCRALNPDDLERIEQSDGQLRIFQRDNLSSQGVSKTGRSEPYMWNGTTYPCLQRRHWAVSSEGMDRLAALDRLVSADGGTLMWKKYENEIPGRRISNQWAVQTRTFQKRYPVQTPESIVERCILMTSEPGDLVLDPTGGSGVTAAAAEKWGRRWIVVDVSPVAIATIRHYMATRIFDWYMLQDSEEGAKIEKELRGGVTGIKNEVAGNVNKPYKNRPALGFVYERVPTVSPRILAYGLDEPPTLLVDRPFVSPDTKRVSGPFTVESETSPFIVSPSAYRDLLPSYSELVARITECMSTVGISSLDDTANMTLNGLVSFSESDGFTHVGTRSDTNERVAVLVGLDLVPMDNSIIRNAAQSAKKHGLHTLIVAAFEYQPLYPDKSVDGVNIIQVHINRALQNKNLKNTEIDRALVMVGEPRIDVTQENGLWVVEISGYDVYDPRSGNVISGDKSDVNCWMIDTDYDGEAFFAKELHFPHITSDWSKPLLTSIKSMLGKNIDESRWESFTSLTSFPFASTTGDIAVKIITIAGDEMMLRGSLKNLTKSTNIKTQNDTKNRK